MEYTLLTTPDIVNLDGVGAGGHAHACAAGVELDVVTEALAEGEGVEGAGLAGAPQPHRLVVAAADQVAAVRRPAAAPHPVRVIGEGPDQT